MKHICKLFIFCSIGGCIKKRLLFPIRLTVKRKELCPFNVDGYEMNKPGSNISCSLLIEYQSVCDIVENYNKNKGCSSFQFLFIFFIVSFLKH